MKRFGDRWQILRDRVQHKNIAHYLDEKANRHRYVPDGVEYNRGLEELKTDDTVEGGKRKYKKSRKKRLSKKRKH